MSVNFSPCLMHTPQIHVRDLLAFIEVKYYQTFQKSSHSIIEEFILKNLINIFQLRIYACSNQFHANEIELWLAG